MIDLDIYFILKRTYQTKNLKYIETILDLNLI